MTTARKQKQILRRLRPRAPRSLQSVQLTVEAARQDKLELTADQLCIKLSRVVMVSAAELPSL